MRIVRSVLPLFLLLGAATAVPSAWAWGCNGHEMVALIAQKHLDPHAQAMVRQILAASPITPDLKRFCRETGLDVFADSSTWADDERSTRPDTAGWHFLDIPRGAPKGDLSQYCPSSGCVTSAIAMQLAVLRNGNASAQERAEALRFVIHFVGDLHQPLHTTTNDDRGGNCVPVGFFGREPEETNREHEDYRPNLHGVWDSDILETFSKGRTPQQVAGELESTFSGQIAAWLTAPVDVSAWVWESHDVAENTVYGQMPVVIAIEKPQEVNACADDNHISMRMLNLHEELGNEYETAVAPAVQKQLVKAGIRLAAVLNQLWP
jgi:hypothetical protein